MKAIKHNIIVSPILHIKLPSGIFISEKEQENPTGIVISAGGGTKKQPMHVKDGDTIVFRRNVGRGLEYEGERYLILNEGNIIGIE